VNIADLITSFSTGTYTVTRTSRGATTRGHVAAGSTTTFSITAAVHPAMGNDLKRLPEGRRSNETRVVYSRTELILGGQGAQYEADLISIGGQDWEVEHVETWNDPVSGDSGYRTIVQAIR
jgi:hypothetical protein